jgi:hypothetical protein
VTSQIHGSERADIGMSGRVREVEREEETIIEEHVYENAQMCKFVQMWIK